MVIGPELHNAVSYTVPLKAESDELVRHLSDCCGRRAELCFSSAVYHITHQKSCTGPSDFDINNLQNV